MHRTEVLLAVFSSSLLTAAAWAQSVETWTPGDNARQWVGVVRFSPTQITMKGGMSLSIQESGTVSYKTDWGPTVNATIYKVTGQTTPKGMTNLCAASKVAFVLISRPPAVGSDVSPREIDSFKGPRFAADSPDYCGRLSFDVGRR